MNLKSHSKKNEICEQIRVIVERLVLQKGQTPVPVDENTRFLGGTLPLDSLDLAVLVTELQTLTRNDPFQAGFKEFQTVGELAELYAQ